MHRGLTGCVVFVIAPVISAVAVVIGIAIVNNIDMEGSTRAAWIFRFFLFFSLVAQAQALGFGSLAAWLLIGIYSVVGFLAAVSNMEVSGTTYAVLSLLPLGFVFAGVLCFLFGVGICAKLCRGVMGWRNGLFTQYEKAHPSEWRYNWATKEYEYGNDNPYGCLLVLFGLVFLAVNMVVGIFLPVFVVDNIIIGIPLMILGIFIKRE